MTGADPWPTCTGCGAVAQDLPVTWSLQITNRGARWLCEQCTRNDLRSIEARLDEA